MISICKRFELGGFQGYSVFLENENKKSTGNEGAKSLLRLLRARLSSHWVYEWLKLFCDKPNGLGNDVLCYLSQRKPKKQNS